VHLDPPDGPAGLFGPGPGAPDFFFTPPKGAWANCRIDQPASFFAVESDWARPRLDRLGGLIHEYQ